jgi:hypothetical protein
MNKKCVVTILINLYVNHGTVRFKGSRGAGMLISAGFSSRIQDDGKAAHPIETSNRNLRPFAPVGSDNSGGVPRAFETTAAPENGEFTITLDYL